MTTHHITRAARLGAAALLCTSALALGPAAHAEPGNGQPQGQPQGQALGQALGQAPGQGGTPSANPPGGTSTTPHVKGKPGNAGQTKPGNAGQGKPGNAGQGAPASSNAGNGGNGGRPAPSSDPAGNNGTVKIAPLGDFDGIPDNTPHVGCSFLVEWYGFDEGADIVSTVSFAEQAPTTGVGMTLSGPSQVFVGGDPASGAGTATGLDGRQQYTLSFTGAPHPQQGYHVKLTIHTSGSIGNDTKTKVFWVAGCATASALATAALGTSGATAPGTSTTTSATTASEVTASGTGQTGGDAGPVAEVAPAASASEQAAEVLAVQAFAAEVAPSTAPTSARVQAQVLPTAVDAGAAGDPADGQDPAGTALLGMLLLALGTVVARLGWIRARG